MADTALNPDESCAVCGDTRENHGDKHHKFSRDGSLEPLKAGAPPRQPLPSQGGISPHIVIGLIEVLAKKGLLTPEELAFIFGGPNAQGTGGSSTSRPGAYKPPTYTR